jgi:hypothetical protein
MRAREKIKSSDLPTRKEIDILIDRGDPEMDI